MTKNKSMNVVSYVTLILGALGAFSCSDKLTYDIVDSTDSTSRTTFLLSTDTELDGASLDVNSKAYFSSVGTGGNMNKLQFSFDDENIIEALWVTTQNRLKDGTELYSSDNKTKYYKYYAVTKNGKTNATQINADSTLMNGINRNIDEELPKTNQEWETYQDIAYLVYPAPTGNNGIIDLTNQTDNLTYPDLTRYAMVGSISMGKDSKKAPMTPQTVIIRFENTRSTPVDIYLKDYSGDSFITGLKCPASLTNGQFLLEVVTTTDKSNAKICTVPAAENDTHGFCYAIIPSSQMIIAEKGDYSIRELTGALTASHWYNVYIENCMNRGISNNHTWIEFPNVTNNKNVHLRWAASNISGDIPFSSLQDGNTILFDGWDGYVIPTQEDWNNLLSQTNMETHNANIEIKNGAIFDKYNSIYLELSSRGFKRNLENGNSTTYNDDNYRYYWTGTSTASNSRTYVKFDINGKNQTFTEIICDEKTMFDNTDCPAPQACVPIKMVLEHNNNW